MPVAAMLPAIITAAGSVGGAALAARGNTQAAQTAAGASTAAAQTQAQADKAALDFQKGAYTDAYRTALQEQANLGPYRDIGFSSLGALASGLNLPAPAAPQAVPANVMPPGLAALANAPGAGTPTATDPFGAFTNSARFPTVTPMTAANRTDPNLFPQPAASTRTLQNFARYAAPTMNASADVVLMQAPDGTTQQVPKDQAAHYLALGAKVVSA